MRRMNRSPLAVTAPRSSRRDRSPIQAAILLLVDAIIALATVSLAIAGEIPQALDVARLADHPALQPFDVAEQPLPDNLFFVRAPGELPVQDGIVVYGAHKDVYLVSGEPSVVRGLARRGCAVLSLQDLPEAAPSVTRDWTWIDTPDPDIEAMVAQVDWTGVGEKIQWLVDFETRYSYAANHQEVAESIGAAFASYGLQTVLHPFYYYGAQMWNVEATQVGTLYPNSYVIICGHFDSTSGRPSVLAPGADDNATGTATVLTAAEILSQHSFEYSIRYVCFSAEEEGLIGSHFYAAATREQNLDIVGVLNFDMIGYWEPGVEMDLEIETNQASLWLAQAIVNAADLYTDTPYELHVYDWAWWGDHFRFWLQGYAAVNHEESWDWGDPDFNPYYHSTRDVIEYVGPDFTVGNVKIAVAALATLASAEPPLVVSFDMRPGSCPNPFNPQSRGVVPALLLGSDEIDVHDIDLTSLRLEDTVSPVKIRFADMGSAYDGSGHPCADTSPDGIVDLALKFSTEEITVALGPAAQDEEATLTLRGRLFDGTVIEGQDVVAIVGGGGGESPPVKRPPVSLRPNAGEKDRGHSVPESFALHQNVPNPFNPTTRIMLDVPAGSGAVTVRVYDVSGRLVRTLLNGELITGQRAVTWDGLDDAGNAVATGTYLCRLTGRGLDQTRKMLLQK